MAEDLYPLYTSAVLVPIFAFPAWILCIPPMYWHFSQRNIAAGSLILWMSLANFFNSINPLIWPRDNMDDWWDGHGYCDIQVHLQAAAVVALPSCTAVIARKLAHVMDTRSITVAPGKHIRIKERVIEIVWCWVFPLLLMAIYYIVQPSRYFLFGITGCVASYHSSWPSIVVSWMWGPISTFVAAFYAGLLIWRLFRYRREFHRLLSARKTTKSRFIRLFLMAIIFIAVYLPYLLFLFYTLASRVKTKYSWSEVHGPNWNMVEKVPSNGSVRLNIWPQIASGYLFFLLFGTGTDAYNTYKRMLCAIGFGKVFPSLLVMRESGTSTPSSISFAKGFASSCASKAKGFFSSRDSVDEINTHCTRSDFVCLSTPSTHRSGRLTHVPTAEPILPRTTHAASQSGGSRSVLHRVFGGRKKDVHELPVFSSRSVGKLWGSEKSPVESVPSGFSARVWTTDDVEDGRRGSTDGVHVMREVRQTHGDDDAGKKQLNADDRR